MTDPRPTRTVACCADHDHATDPSCEIGAKEAIIELTDAEIAQREEDEAVAIAREAERQAAAEALEALKVSARAKLVSGQPLTEEEAAVLVI